MGSTVGRRDGALVGALDGEGDGEGDGAGDGAGGAVARASKPSAHRRKTCASGAFMRAMRLGFAYLTTKKMGERWKEMARRCEWGW